jgi:hypothetical protein
MTRPPNVMAYFKTPAEVAAELGLKEPTVRRLALRFKTFTRVGNRIMLTADDVAALIDKIRNPPMVEQYMEDDSPDPFA